MKRYYLTTYLTLLTISAFAQWSLDSCITYAEQNSFEVEKAILALNNARIAHASAKTAMTPSINAEIGQNFSFGLAQGANNLKQQRTQATTSFNAAVSMPVFTGLRITNQIKRTKVDIQVAISDIESIRNDIKINVTAYYLNALYNKELINICTNQLELRKQLLKQTTELVNNGRTPESELYEIQAQVAQDSAELTNAHINYRQTLVDLCQLLNYKNIEQFDITPIQNTNIDTKLLQPITDIYQHTLTHHPALKSAHLKAQSARLAIKETQAEYYPQLNLNASWGTGYYHIFKNNNPAFGKQFVDNGSEIVGLSLSIPIYNRMQVRNNIKLQRNNLIQTNINIAEQEAKLYKDIQSAYYNAISAQEKYQSALSVSKASQEALKYAITKYQLGKINSYEYNEVQARNTRALAELTQAKYDYALKYQILNHYANL